MTGVHIKRGNLETGTWGECHMKKTEISDPSTSRGTAKIATYHQKLRERPGTDSPPCPQKEPTSPTFLSWASSFRDCEEINLCCLSHRVGGAWLHKPELTQGRRVCGEEQDYFS